MDKTSVVLLLLLGCACSDRSPGTSVEQELPKTATVIPASPPAPRKGWAECMSYEEFLEMESLPPPIVGPFCVSKLSSGGCVPSLEWTGIPSLSGAGSFVVRATRLPPNVSAYLVYGIEGRQEPFEGGYSCVGGTIRELPARNSGGTGPCSGAVEFDLTSLIRSGTDAAMTPRAKVYCQVRFRDESDPAGFGTGSTHALQFIVQP